MCTELWIFAILQGRPGMLQTCTDYRLSYAPRGSESGGVAEWTCGFFRWQLLAQQHGRLVEVLTKSCHIRGGKNWSADEVVLTQSRQGENIKMRLSRNWCPNTIGAPCCCTPSWWLTCPVGLSGWAGKAQVWSYPNDFVAAIKLFLNLCSQVQPTLSLSIFFFAKQAVLHWILHVIPLDQIWWSHVFALFLLYLRALRVAQGRRSESDWGFHGQLHTFHGVLTTFLDGLDLFSPCSSHSIGKEFLSSIQRASKISTFLKPAITRLASARWLSTRKSNLPIAMSALWGQQGMQPPAGSVRQNSGNRPPICFNCNQEGHFLVACPHPRQGTT